MRKTICLGSHICHVCKMGIWIIFEYTVVIIGQRLAVNSSIFIWIILFVYLFFVIQKTSETSITFLLIAHDFLLNILILLCFFSCLALCTKILLYLNILHGSTSIIFFPYRSCGRIISPTSAELSYYTTWSFFHTCK